MKETSTAVQPTKNLMGLQAIGLFLFLAVFVVIMAFFIQTFVTSNVQFGVDFHTFWVASRAMFLERVSPFSPAVTLETQLAIYGRPAIAGEDQLGFAYPPYSLLPVLPMVGLAYPWAQAFWIAINLTLFMVAVYLAFSILPRWIWASVIFFYPAGYGMIIGNFALMIGSFFLMLHAFFREGQRQRRGIQILAGVLLAWLTLKPQITWLLVLFFLLFAIRDRLSVVLSSFTSSLGFALLISWILVPSWPTQWLDQILANADEIHFMEPLAMTFAKWIVPEEAAFYVAGIVVVGSALWTGKVLFDWWRREASDLLVYAWIVLFIQLIHPLLLSPDQIIILLPLLLWIEKKRLSTNYRVGMVWAGAILIPWFMFFGPIVIFDDYQLTKYAVTKVPPLLFILWTLWLTREEIDIQAKKKGV